MHRWLPAVALLLASCQNEGNPGICGAGLPVRFPDALTIKNSDDQLQVTAYCVERWAARLAKGAENADTVARAAIAGCHDAIESLRTMTERDHIAAEGFSDVAHWQRRALFIAVQTRAGDCYPDA